MSAASDLLPALLVIYALPYIGWRMLRIGRSVPLVVVQILTGLLLGPGLLGGVVPDWYHAILTPDVLGAIGAIATLAVALFVWAAGVELDLRGVREAARETAVAAALAIVAPLAAGTAAALLLISHGGWVGTSGSTWQAALGIGMACAVTALPILVLLLDELGMLRSPLGRRVLRIASVDDVLIWAVLGIILLDAARLERQFSFLILFAGAALAIRRLMPRLAERERWPIALIWLLASASAADWAGLHFMVGAFLAGVVTDREWLVEAKVDAFREVVLLTLMPVFFLNTGLRTDWALGGVAIAGAAALLLLATVGGKLAGMAIAGRLLHWPRGTAAIVGLLLQTKALVMIIFSRILLDRHIISGASFTALLLMAVASTALTIPAVKCLMRLSRAPL
ncbi:cation:proton antiporter [Sphingomonas sp.]|uniref:cation:proton antiporter n=1 Tax=Sphingomonas sp. TaxID=28214 RepID=UPI003B0014FF